MQHTQAKKFDIEGLDLYEDTYKEDNAQAVTMSSNPHQQSDKKFFQLMGAFFKTVEAELDENDERAKKEELIITKLRSEVDRVNERIEKLSK